MVPYFRIISLECLFLVFFSCQPQVERLYLKGQSQQAEGKYREALKSYEKIITLDPSGSQARSAYLQMGNVYFYGLRDYKSALGIFKDFAERGKKGPEVFEARKNLAEILYGYLRNYREAIVQYQRLVQDYPDRKERISFQAAIADCYFELNNFNQSRVEYREILLKYPTWDHQDRAHFRIAESFYMENRCKKAQGLYQKVIEKYPQSAYRIRAQFGRANCMEELGNFNQALALYGELLNRYPSKPVIEMKIKNLQKRLQELNPEKTLRR